MIRNSGLNSLTTAQRQEKSPICSKTAM